MRITWAWSLLFCFDQNKISRTVHNNLFAPNWNNYPPSPRAEMSQRPLPPRLIFDVCLVTSSTCSKMPSTAAAKWYKINTKVSSFQKSHHNHGIYSKLLYFIHKWWGASQAFYCVVTLHIMQHWVCETVDGSFLPINNKRDFGAKWAKCIKFGFLLPQCSVSLHGFQDCIVSWHIWFQNLQLTTVNLVDVLKQMHWIGGSQSVPVIC